MGNSASVSLRSGLSPFGIDLGLEPAIEANGRRHAPDERRKVSRQWLCGTVLTGLAGASLIGAAIYAALDRQATFAQAPEWVVAGPKGTRDIDSGLRRGDRLVKKVDIVADKQSFRAPTTVNVGDKQVIRLRGYTHVATTLTMAPTDLADQVPPFNPLKLLSSDQPNVPDAPADSGPVLDAAEVAFVTRDMMGADPALYAGGLSPTEVEAQVAQHFKAAASAGNKPLLPLPAQMLLMRTSRAGSDPTGGLAYANPGGSLDAPFSSIEVKMVPENVTLVPRSETGRDAPAAEERLVVVRHGEALDDILKANGATREQTRAIIDALGAKRGVPPVQEGRRLKIQLTSPDGTKPTLQIARLSVYADETLESVVAINDAGQYVRVEAVQPARKPVPVQSANDDPEDTGGMRLYDSIYQTALKQQIPKPIINSMIRIFSNDVDFQQSAQAGDSFDAFYTNDQDSDGRQDLLFASLTVRNEVLRYYRFQAPDDPTAEYYDDAGRSIRKFLIRKPVPNGIFTSGFGMRFHPILGYSRPHTGCDWAAPVGTPILAAGNGTLLKVERSSSYGNHIEIQHANGYITTYSHMVGFARGMADGVKVRQGQVIGYLGQTGLATGPHLHYEVIVNGHFVDPMRVKLARTNEITGKGLVEFKREHDRIDALMASAPNAVQNLQKRASN